MFDFCHCVYLDLDEKSRAEMELYDGQKLSTSLPEYSNQIGKI